MAVAETAVPGARQEVGCCASGGYLLEAAPPPLGDPTSPAVRRLTDQVARWLLANCPRPFYVVDGTLPDLNGALRYWAVQDYIAGCSLFWSRRPGDGDGDPIGTAVALGFGPAPPSFAGLFFNGGLPGGAVVLLYRCLPGYDGQVHDLAAHWGVARLSDFEASLRRSAPLLGSAAQSPRWHLGFFQLPGGTIGEPPVLESVRGPRPWDIRDP